MAEGRVINAQNPWPWLDPFTESAAHFFNGRDDDVQLLFRSVLATPACVFFSKSGLGKTSLLLAGLFPLLRVRKLLPVYLHAGRGAAIAGLSSRLRRALEDAIEQASLEWSEAGEHFPADADDVALLWERLHDRRRRLLDASGQRWTVVFVLDQFEEVFTLELDEHRRRQSFEELGDLVQNRIPPSVARRLDQHDDLIDDIDQDSQSYRVLLSLREDFLPELEAWADLIPRLGSNRYRLMPMSREQALDAVLKTGRQIVDRESAERIVDFLGRESTFSDGRVPRESRRIEPPLLSLVCSSLNADRLAKTPAAQQIDVSDLENRGAQILDRFYDEAFAELSNEQCNEAARWVESDLITADGTRRPFPLHAVEEMLLPALRHLVNRRLLRIENTEQGDQVELVHDRLAVVALQRAQSRRQHVEETERLQREKQDAEWARDKAELKVANRTRWLGWLGMAVVIAVLTVAWWVDKLDTQITKAEGKVQTSTDEARKAQAENQIGSNAALLVREAEQLLKSGQPSDISRARELLSKANTAYEKAAQEVNQVAERGVRSASPLPALNIDVIQTSVSGVSAGGFMAVQFQVAHSSIIKGAGVVAGGPYNCSKGDVFRAVSQCSCTGEPTVSCKVTPTSANAPGLAAEAKAMAAKGLIDPVSEVASDRILTVSGAKDTLVPPLIADQLTAFYAALGVPASSLSAVRLPDAAHTMPTQDYGIACSKETEPYIGNCAYDSAGQILSWIYGAMKPPGSTPAGKFIQFDQGAYIPLGGSGTFNWSTGLDSTGWVYVPDSCAKGEECRVHVALHGCKQGQSYLPLKAPPGGGLYNGTLFVKHTGYDRWADNNKLVILYPQAVSIPFRNPNGCWDWWGYTGDDYATKNGVQIRTLRAMIDALAGAGPK
ncbi:MAG: hypothetical protein JSR64_11455 [Nitrospira sp.]|nr:hypothetical protein [Nitrospira sp.]